jgi:FMN phosphatase YigB (HAD superfamily)
MHEPVPSPRQSGALRWPEREGSRLTSVPDGGSVGDADPAAVLPAARGVSFDCFATLVDAERPTEPWTAVARELTAQDVPVPVDWEAAYRTGHADLERLEEQALGVHVRDALASRDVECSIQTATEAVVAAFDGPVAARPDAERLLAALDCPVGVVSNCAVSGLVERSLERAGLAGDVDAVVTSLDCGRLKPHPRPFETVADRLDVALAALVHVGDDAGADGAAGRAGATAILLGETSLDDLADAVEGSTCR